MFLSDKNQIQSTDSLKDLGNAAFAVKHYEQACAYYSEAIDLDPHNHVLYGNRAAALFHLQQLSAALQDAKKSIDLEPTWTKGYLREAEILEKLDMFDEAYKAYCRVLGMPSLTGQNRQIAMHKLKSYDKTKLQKAVQKGFLVIKNPRTSMYPDKEAVSATIEDKEMQKWKKMLRQLKKGCTKAGRDEFGQPVVLNAGLFQKLIDEAEFRKLLYPGMTDAQLRNAPRNLQQLFSNPWYDQELLDLMPKVQARAKSVLDNVKEKGASRNEIMSSELELSLWPQILQEAFARELLYMIQTVSKRQCSMLATDSRLVADPKSDRHCDNQIDDLVHTLETSEHGFGLLDGFIGPEWTNLMVDDVVRMKENSLLSSDCSLDSEYKPIKHNPYEMSDKPSLLFVDHQLCRDTYPAVLELLDQMHAIPFEINRIREKNAFENFQPLCAPLPHSTLLQVFCKGQGQRLRSDSGGFKNQNGIVLTCMYCISAPSNGVISLKVHTNMLAESSAEHVIPWKNDRLVVFKSTSTLNEVPVISSDEDLYLLTFWIHGGCGSAYAKVSLE